MAADANTTRTYDRTHIKEDLHEVINNMEPERTVGISNFSSGSADAVVHEWTTDKRRNPSKVARPEGDRLDPGARPAPVRLTNICQIVSEELETSGTSRAVNTLGGDEHTRQKIKLGVELRENLEYSLWNDQAKKATDPREMGSVRAYISSNVNLGATGTAATGDGTDVPGNGTARAVTDAIMEDIMEQMFSTNGKKDRVAFMPLKFQNAMKALTSVSDNRTDIGRSNMGSIIGAVDMYVSPAGNVAMVPTHQMPVTANSYSLITDPSTWCIDYLRQWFSKPLGDQGDSSIDLVGAEATLRCDDEVASATINDIDLS